VVNAPRLWLCPRCWLKWDDPAIGVKWPAPDRAILSQKDRNCPPLAEAENNFEY
jgi:dTDP-4-dehydrorhamnose 3,5-epimerase